MRDLRDDLTTLTAAPFAAALAALGVKLPLRQSVEEAGVVVDDDGEDLLSVDVWRDRPDDKARKLADAVAALVNLGAGFVPVATGDPAEPLRWEPRAVRAAPAAPTADCPLPTAGAGGAR